MWRWAVIQYDVMHMLLQPRLIVWMMRYKKDGMGKGVRVPYHRESPNATYFLPFLPSPFSSLWFLFWLDWGAFSEDRWKGGFWNGESERPDVSV
jgi:hypothetical protein